MHRNERLHGLRCEHCHPIARCHAERSERGRQLRNANCQRGVIEPFVGSDERETVLVTFGRTDDQVREQVRAAVTHRTSAGTASRARWYSVVTGGDPRP
jgi:hypothetical protein